MIDIKAQKMLLHVGTQAGKERFVMMAQTYNTLSESKVISDAALRTGMSKQVVRACWEGCAEIISAWATEGQSIPIPGLGHMRFGIRATSVEKVEDVSTKLITSRRVIFIPSVAIKDELPIQTTLLRVALLRVVQHMVVLELATTREAMTIRMATNRLSFRIVMLRKGV